MALADEFQTANWLAYGRTHNERRFSPSDQINASNVANLKVDWYMDLPRDVGLVSTPLVVDGTLYFTGTMNVIRAVDAVTGELLWEYDPQVAKEIAGRRRTGWKHNRGISFYEGKIFAATWDGRLFALDAQTGDELWMVRTFGIDRALYITGAPKAFKGKVIGNESEPPIKAILHAPKNGFFYVINRENGKLVSAEPFVETTWATHIDIETGRPVEVPGARYEVFPAYVTPNAYGARTAGIQCRIARRRALPIFRRSTKPPTTPTRASALTAFDWNRSLAASG